MPQLFGGQVPSSTFMEPEDAAGEQIIAVPIISIIIREQLLKVLVINRMH